MKKTVRKYAIGMVMLLSVFSMTVLANGFYESTYDMTGGVFSQSITANSYIETTVRPNKGTLGCNMGVILATKHWYGWDGPEKYVSSTEGGTVTHYCNGTYKIWLRDYAGARWSGDVEFRWK